MPCPLFVQDCHLGEDNTFVSPSTIPISGVHDEIAYFAALLNFTGHFLFHDKGPALPPEPGSDDGSCFRMTLL
jgi:hypothetical protein